MKVLHVTPAYFPATYWGGPIYSVYGLSNALAKIDGVEIKVLTTDSAGPKLSERISNVSFPEQFDAGYKVYYCKRWMAASVSPGMFIRLIPMVRWADVVHLTGVYSPPTIPTLFVCRLLGKPIVWSPRGSLQRWEGSTRPKIKVFWEWICNCLVKQGACILHATVNAEAIDSRLRISKAVVAVVPNGVVIPERLEKRKWKPNGQLRLLYIGRLHPIKGLENLIQALAILPENIMLTICGTGEPSFKASLYNLIEKAGIEERVEFKGHVSDDGKRRAFKNADVCVLPSFSENFGMVVAEALAHGLPVIAGKGTPWPEVEKHHCGYWVENDPTTLADAIINMSTQDLEKMGKSGRDWMKAEYGWQSIGVQMFLLYQRMISKVGLNEEKPVINVKL